MSNSFTSLRWNGTQIEKQDVEIESGPVGLFFLPAAFTPV